MIRSLKKENEVFGKFLGEKNEKYFGLSLTTVVAAHASRVGSRAGALCALCTRAFRRDLVERSKKELVTIYDRELSMYSIQLT